MKIIKDFIQTSPTVGVVTAPYDVILNKTSTVGELVDEILTKKEWGDIVIDDHRVKYCDSDCSCIPEKIKSLTVISLKASGEYGHMDYFIKTRPSIECLQFNGNFYEQKRFISEALPSLKSVFVLGKRSLDHPDHVNFCSCSFSKPELVDALLNFMLLSQDTARPVITAVLKYIDLKKKTTKP